MRYETIVEKYNHNHDPATGRFTSGPGGSGKASGGPALQRERTTIEEDAASDNNKALSFLLNRGADFDDVMQAHKNGNAKDMAKEIIDKRYRELDDRYNAATEGQKRFMKMTKDEAADFAKEAAKKEIPPSLNTGSPLQHLVYELGMNEKPTTLSRDEFEKQAAESPYGKIYRGVRDNDLTGISSKEVIDSTATGDTTYLGSGLHSDGIYFSQNKATADTYAGDGAGTVMEATLNKNARIIDMDELSTMRAQDDVSLPNAGAYALYQGYNAISVKNTDGNAYVIALDRSALAIPDDYIVKKAEREMPGAEIARAFNAFIPENRKKEGDTMDKEELTILKSDDDKRLVFGWASIAQTADGDTIKDRQNDVIEPDDLEEAAYEYVLNFRDTGEEHLESFRKKGKLVESCVFTAEKQKAMGLQPGTLPVGWWVGFYIEDEDAWQRIKNGTYKMFSIEGRAERVPLEQEEQVGKSAEEPDYIEIEEVEPVTKQNDFDEIEEL